jgi:hypothetical protein
MIMTEFEQGKAHATVKNFYPDFMNVLSQVKDPKKSGVNPHFRMKYSTLKDILESIRPALHDNGFLILQEPTTIREEGVISVLLTTSIVHKSGEYLQNIITLPTRAGDVQEFGSIVTYLRRYSLLSIFSLAPDEDDDGERAVGRVQDTSRRQERSHVPNSTRTESTNVVDIATKRPDTPVADAHVGTGGWVMDHKDLVETWKKTKALGFTDKEWKAFVKSYWNVDSSKELTEEQYNEWKTAVSAKDACRASLLELRYNLPEVKEALQNHDDTVKETLKTFPESQVTDDTSLTPTAQAEVKRRPRGI